MDRRNSIKLILAAAIAPAFVAEGLMPVKPTAALMQSAGLDLYGTNSVSAFTSYFSKKMLEEIERPPFWNNYLFIIHPDMKAELVEAAKGDARYLASVKWMDKNSIADEYMPDPQTGLMIDKRRLSLMTAGNKVGRLQIPLLDIGNE